MAFNATTPYQIIDEPRPGLLSRFVVNPFWPMLGFMFGGSFFSWIWFLLNSLAMGSPTRVREMWALVAGVLGYFLLFFSMIYLVNNGLIDGLTHEYTRILLVGFALVPSYYLYLRQNAAFELFEHFGGKALNGIPILLLGYFFGSKFQVAIITLVADGVALWTR